MESVICGPTNDRLWTRNGPVGEVVIISPGKGPSSPLHSGSPEFPFWGQGGTHKGIVAGTRWLLVPGGHWSAGTFLKRRKNFPKPAKTPNLHGHKNTR